MRERDAGAERGAERKAGARREAASGAAKAAHDNIFALPDFAAGAARVQALSIKVNPNLARLQTYPFEKLRALFAGIEPPAELKPIRLSIGEPQHPTPGFIRQTLADNLGGLSSYPATLGTDALRGAIAHWLERRYGLPIVDTAGSGSPDTRSAASSGGAASSR